MRYGYVWINFVIYMRGASVDGSSEKIVTVLICLQTGTKDPGMPGSDK